VKDRTGGRIPVVCADIIAISYREGGLDLDTYDPAWRWSPDWSTDPKRNVASLQVLLDKHGQGKKWNSVNEAELGDMVLNYNLVHSAIITEIKGSRNDASQIIVVQASYTHDVINSMTLADWQTATGGNASFGHPYP
jgi:hypothetical protein